MPAAGSSQPFLWGITAEDWKTIATLVALVLSAGGLLLNAHATLRNLKSRRLLNYQELVKSHRELWKMALEKPEKYGRILQSTLDLSTSPITIEERRFVNLLLQHVTAAFYFSKHSDVLAARARDARARDARVQR